MNPETLTQMHQAVATGDVARATALSEQFSKILGQVLDHGRNWLHVAAQHDQPVMVRWLASKGVDANAVDGKGRTPLWLAPRDGGSFGTIESLLECGADPNAVFKGDPLMIQGLRVTNTARIKSLVDMLLHHGADPNLAGKHENTPLHRAAWRNLPDVVRLLLSAGADPAVKNSAQRDAVAMAKSKGFLELADDLQAWIHAQQANQVMQQGPSLGEKIQPLV